MTCFLAAPLSLTHLPNLIKPNLVRMNIQRQRLAVAVTHLRLRPSVTSLRIYAPALFTSARSLAAAAPGVPRRLASLLPVRAFATMTPMDEDGAMPSIALTPLEDAIVTLLADTCAWIGQTHPQPPAELAPPIEYTEAWEVTARIAGGWVRDRVSGVASSAMRCLLICRFYAAPFASFARPRHFPLLAHGPHLCSPALCIPSILAVCCLAISIAPSAN